MDARKIGLFISQLRKQKGLTQQQLAQKLNVTDRAVSRWETGKLLPDVGLLKELGDVLGVSVSGLLAGEAIAAKTRGQEIDDIDDIDDIIDDIIIDAMNDSRRMIHDKLNGVLMLIGVVVLLSGLISITDSIAYVLGLIPLAVVAVNKIMARYDLNKYQTMNNTSRNLPYFGALACLLAALVLQLLPNAVKLQFSPGQEQTVASTYSYFSLLPFGYGEFFLLPIGMLTVTMIILIIISLINKWRWESLEKTIFFCNIIACIFAFMSYLIIGTSSATLINYIITILLTVSVVFLDFANVREQFL